MSRIALLTHVRHPIAPPFAGGMEAHSWHLARGLARRGHDVTLFASGDSAAAAPPGVRVHSITAQHYDASYPWHRFHGTDVLTDHLDLIFARAGRDLIAGGYDVVHNNSLHRFPPRLAVSHRLPMVTSLHVPPFPALRRAVRDGAAPWTRFTVTSRGQRDLWWPGDAPDAATVLHNGIELEDWPFSSEGDGSTVWSGRITPTKGPHLAVRAARLMGISLTLFGTIEHRDYYEAEVEPLLGGDIRYGGHLAGSALAGELGRASLMFFTPLWDEPFGLAAIEAMATGLPIACLDRGAVREVVAEAGRYAINETPVSLACAAKEALSIPRTLCRARVERAFALDRMVQKLELIYGEVRGACDATAESGRFAQHELQVASARE